MTCVLYWSSNGVGYVRLAYLVGIKIAHTACIVAPTRLVSVGCFVNIFNVCSKIHGLKGFMRMQRLFRYVILENFVNTYLLGMRLIETLNQVRSWYVIRWIEIRLFSLFMVYLVVGHRASFSMLMKKHLYITSTHFHHQNSNNHLIISSWW